MSSEKTLQKGYENIENEQSLFCCNSSVCIS